MSKLFWLGFLAVPLAVAGGVVYGWSYSSPDVKREAISWGELEDLLTRQKGRNVRKITCHCDFFPTPDTNAILIELEKPARERTIASSELPVYKIWTGNGALHHKTEIVNPRLSWIFQEALAHRIDLELKAYAPVTKGFVSSVLIKNGERTESFAEGIRVAGPQTGRAPWLVSDDD